MKLRRFEERGEVVIDAPVERVFAVASDPTVVPEYAGEVERIEVIDRPGDGVALVRSHLRVAGLRFPCLYRYRYRPPTRYSGVQEGGGILRGYFSFTFRPAAGGATRVSHAEGLLSRVPGVAWIAGFVYFRLLSRGGMRDELARLKQRVESCTSR